MSQEFVPVTDLTTPSDKFQSAVEDLSDRIQNQDIPSWILLPKRAAGEHATDGAWFGVVMAECSNAASDDDETVSIDARIAWDTDERHRRKSSVGAIPEGLLETLHTTADDIDDPIERYTVRITYDTAALELTDVEPGFTVSPIEEEAVEGEDVEDEAQ